jgi:tRNA modification GTPase
MQDTIYALATGSLACAVSIIRVSGPHAAEIGRRFCSVELVPRVARYCVVRDPSSQEWIDSGVVLFFSGPSSFTGEDCLEFQLHGSRAVVARMLLALENEDGTRMALPGEFIRRAFDHGKLPLTSVEGIADLIVARTELQRRQALAQAAGGLASRARQWRDMLLEALALVTAEIDFADEAEAPTLVVLPVQAIVNQLAHEFRQALRDSDRAERVKEGFKVVLCGPPNVGKSTLMNTLAQRDVAIVTEHAGTTRDVIQIELDLGGVSVVLSDTAGLRDSIDPVEVIGVARSRQVMANADLLLWLSDGSQALGSDENTERRLVIASKLDDAQDLPEWADLGLSAKTGFGIAALVARIELLARAAVAGEMSVVTNARQRRCVEVASRHAERLVTDDTLALEIIADELLRCSRALEELLGPIGVEDILGSVFSRFCMGK